MKEIVAIFLVIFMAVVFGISLYKHIKRRLKK